ncbi:SLBB domain-containing protein [Rubrivirga marina]|uniref:Soluble ligand binding domain-containing protein n=1 Tax=Rubrivirga marina TaxID=1196024 RepID=A0A271IXZ6_9BACT|nr:SLBB domain-containing protein [Rubrivirga marina]PAP75957.1 hypothetical protein BSZ37_05640 [Rubrivirga marina]
MRVLLLPHSRLLLTVVLSTLALAPGAGAQSVIGRAESMASNAEAYYYVRPGTASVRVQVLGAVRSPGLYEVSEGTGLGPLLALAGGPALGTTPSGTRAETAVKLYRSGAAGQELAFQAPLEQLVGSVSTPPVLDGDVLLIEVASGRIESADTNASSFYYVRPGTASVRVQVLGAVRSPGLYEVSEGTGLGPLLALAGGPTLGTMPADTRTVVTIRLHRPRGGSTELVYEGSFEPTAGVVLPTLQDGDVVVTEARSRRTISWRDAIQVISAVGVVALAIDRLSGTGN